MKTLLALSALLLTAAAPPALDPDTRAWWSTTAELSNDPMEGRDTGSAAYDAPRGWWPRSSRRRG